MDDIGFSWLAFEATLWKCARLALASLACWGILRLLDNMAGVSFKGNVVDKLASPGVGIYFGLRFLGVAILGAAIFSASGVF